MENPTHCHSLPVWLLGMRVALFKFRQATSTAVPSGCWSPVITTIHLSLHEFPDFHLLRCESLWAYSRFSCPSYRVGPWVSCPPCLPLACSWKKPLKHWKLFCDPVENGKSTGAVLDPLLGDHTTVSSICCCFPFSLSVVSDSLDLMDCSVPRLPVLHCLLEF